ncbi:hypothetical protein Salat_1775000 [Sesamum alatum]|uniref:Uncharacterized protein n=1 Tax=Sesamum alatum TaxID=300844 RepID=A0AAE2CKS1_9LAMI|nr:hypothetical protein Salat_1775000 [Sesamum alatum]
MADANSVILPPLDPPPLPTIAAPMVKKSYSIVVQQNSGAHLQFDPARAAKKTFNYEAGASMGRIASFRGEPAKSANRTVSIPMEDPVLGKNKGKIVMFQSPVDNMQTAFSDKSGPVEAEKSGNFSAQYKVPNSVDMDSDVNETLAIIALDNCVSESATIGNVATSSMTNKLGNTSVAKNAFKSAIVETSRNNPGASADKRLIVTNDEDYNNVVPVSNLALTENMPAINISSDSVPKTVLHAKASVSDMAIFQGNNAVTIETAPTVNTVASNVTDIDITGNMHAVCSNVVQPSSIIENGTNLSANKKLTTSCHPTPIPNDTFSSNDIDVLVVKNTATSAHNKNAADNHLQFDTKATPTQNAHTTHAAKNLHSNKNTVDTSTSNYIIENQEYFNYDDPLLVDLLDKNWDLENMQTHNDKSIFEEIEALNDLFDRNMQQRVSKTLRFGHPSDMAENSQEIDEDHTPIFNRYQALAHLEEETLQLQVHNPHEEEKPPQHLKIWRP